MKKRTSMILLALSAALLTHTVVLSHPAAAQTYGESAYGGGVYEDLRTALEADQSSTSSGESVLAPGSDSTNPLEERDADEEQELSEDDLKPSDSGDTRDSGERKAQPDNGDSKESDSHSRPYSRWVSLGAIATALFLILFAVVRRRGRQN